MCVITHSPIHPFPTLPCCLLSCSSSRYHITSVLDSPCGSFLWMSVVMEVSWAEFGITPSSMTHHTHHASSIPSSLVTTTPTTLAAWPVRRGTMASPASPLWSACLLFLSWAGQLFFTSAWDVCVCVCDVCMTSGVCGMCDVVCGMYAVVWCMWCVARVMWCVCHQRLPLL